jgi:hypothetical protein
MANRGISIVSIVVVIVVIVISIIGIARADVFHATQVERNYVDKVFVGGDVHVAERGVYEVNAVDRVEGMDFGVVQADMMNDVATEKVTLAEVVNDRLV